MNVGWNDDARDGWTSFVGSRTMMDRVEPKERVNVEVRKVIKC